MKPCFDLFNFFDKPQTQTNTRNMYGTCVVIISALSLMTQSNERMFLNHSSQPSFSRKCMEIDVENFNAEIGA